MKSALIKTWLRRGVVLLAVLYPIALAAVIIAMRFVGERWWATGAALYLPRIGFALPLVLLVPVLAVLRLRGLLALQLLSLVLVVFPLMGFVLPGVGDSSRSGSGFRLLTYNINSALGGEDKIVEEIERYSPDVVLFQEIGGSEGALTKRLSATYPTIRASGQFLIASRFPVVSSSVPARLPFYGVLRSPRFVQQVLDTPLGKIAVYNVHPISPREGLIVLRGQGLRREALSGRLLFGLNAWALRANNGLRNLQIQAIGELADHEPYPVVIAGDTNLPTLSGILFRHLSAYRDAFAEAGWGLGYTFPTNRRKGAWMRLDRILFRGPLRAVHVEVGKSRASDHRCVVADLRADSP
jgi:vancomycin resistance protein VanJ